MESIKDRDSAVRTSGGGNYCVLTCRIHKGNTEGEQEAQVTLGGGEDLDESIY